MKAKLFWTISSFIFLILLFFILTKVQIKPDGDIVEYYGVTETLLNHGSLDLRAGDITKLEQYIDAPKFDNPGYYLLGRFGGRYPVHFWAYSLLLIPARLTLEALGANPLLSFPLTNLFLLFGTLIFLLKRFLKKPLSQVLFFVLVFSSPLVFYLTWPGPDMLYLGLLLIAVFYSFQKQLRTAAYLVALASWHSQPLAALAVGLIILNLWKERRLLGIGWGAVSIAALPYLYNLYAFGVFTPWTLLENTYAQINGFGLSNLSLKKFFEQFFDLNLGLFWYSPLLIYFSARYFIRKLQKRQWEHIVIITGFLLTAFFYQTNPAWHYGTTGFGPTRHIIFILPLLIFLSLKYAQKAPKRAFGFVSVVFLVLQGYSLFFNNYFYPDTTRALYHNPYAQYVLDNHPQLYNPSPEIFIDRTLHSDGMFPQTAVYQTAGFCRKAYLLPGGVAQVRAECGFIPETEIGKLKLLNNLSKYEGIYLNY